MHCVIRDPHFCAERLNSSIFSTNKNKYANSLYHRCAHTHSQHLSHVCSSDEPVEFEELPVEVQDHKKITDHFKGLVVCRMNSRSSASGSGRSTRQLNINVMFGGPPALNMNKTPPLSHVAITPSVSFRSPPPRVLQAPRIARLSRSFSSTTGHSSGDYSSEHDNPKFVSPREQPLAREM